MHNSVNSLRGGANAQPHVVVATPRRLIDLCVSMRVWCAVRRCLLRLDLCVSLRSVPCAVRRCFYALTYMLPRTTVWPCVPCATS